MEMKRRQKKNKEKKKISLSSLPYWEWKSSARQKWNYAGCASMNVVMQGCYNGAGCENAYFPQTLVQHISSTRIHRHKENISSKLFSLCVAYSRPIDKVALASSYVSSATLMKIEFPLFHFKFSQWIYRLISLILEHIIFENWIYSPAAE